MSKALLTKLPVNAFSSRSKGFTLLELLVVIVIISIMFSMLAISIRVSSPEEVIQEEAKRLNRLVQLALEEAVLRNVEIGLQFSINGYQFLQLEEGNWTTISGDKLLRPRELPRDMEIELAVEQLDVLIGDEASDDEETSDLSEEKLRPQVFLMSSEEITPEFSARFTIPGERVSYIVNGTLDGKHEVKLSDL